MFSGTRVNLLFRERILTKMKFYSKVRIALMTFTLGLASVWMANGLEIAWSEVPVDLPTAESGEVLAIFPIERRFMPRGGGGSGG